MIYLKVEVKQTTESATENLLTPAWVDHDEVDVNERPLRFSLRHPDAFFSQPAVLDISSRLKLKRKLQDKGDDLENENLFTVLRVDEMLPNSSEIGIKRLYDANRERLSSGKLTSVEFNPNYHMFLTGSVDTVLAIFQVS